MLNQIPESLILKLRRAQFIAFDNDGTLFNGLDLSWVAFQKSWKAVCSKHNVNLEIPTKDDFKSQIGKPAHEFFPELLPEKYRFLSPELHAGIARHEISAITKGEGRLFDDVLHMLETLKKRGYKLILVSNASTNYFTACVENLGYKEFFNGTFCVGDSLKDKSEILHDAMKLLNLTIGVMVGDRKSDIIAGKDNQLLTIGMSYGYGTPAELAHANIILDNPNDLLLIT